MRLPQILPQARLPQRIADDRLRGAEQIVGTSMMMLALGVALAGVAGSLLIPALSLASLRAWRRLGLRARLRGQSDVGRVVLEGGIPGLGALSALLLRSGFVSRTATGLVQALAARGIIATEQTACQAGVVAALTLFALGWVLTGNLMGAFALTLAVGAFAAWRVERGRREHRDVLLRQLPDALRALGVYYGSGLTLLQSFEQAGRDIPAPLGPLLADVASDVRAGLPASQALERLRVRSGLEQVSFAAIAIEVQQRSGGALQPLLDRAARDIADILSARRELEVKTAQSRLSARIVSAMPVFVLLMLMLVNPSYLVGFLTSPIGLGMFALAIALEVLGILLCRRILNASGPGRAGR